MLIAFSILPGERKMGESKGESKKERMREREEEKQSVRDPLSSLVPEIENSQVFWDIKWNV